MPPWRSRYPPRGKTSQGEVAVGLLCSVSKPRLSRLNISGAVFRFLTGAFLREKQTFVCVSPGNGVLGTVGRIMTKSRMKLTTDWGEIPVCPSFPVCCAPWPWRYLLRSYYGWVVRDVAEAEPLGGRAAWKWMGDPRVNFFFFLVWSGIPA